MVGLFIRTAHWKWSKCPSVDEWTNKLWYFPTMKSCSATKGMHFWAKHNVGASQNTIFIILYIRSLTQKTTFYIISFIWNSKREKLYHSDRKVIARGRDGVCGAAAGGGESCKRGMRQLLGATEKFSILIEVVIGGDPHICQSSSNCTHKSAFIYVNYNSSWLKIKTKEKRSNIHTSILKYRLWLISLTSSCFISWFRGLIHSTFRYH